MSLGATPLAPLLKHPISELPQPSLPLKELRDLDLERVALGIAWDNEMKQIPGTLDSWGSFFDHSGDP